MIENGCVTLETLLYSYFNSFFVISLIQILAVVVSHFPFSDVIIHDMSIFGHVESMPFLVSIYANFPADFKK